MNRLQPNPEASVRILIGTQFPGGATCLVPVARELHRRQDVDVQVVARGHGADFFRNHEISFTDLTSMVIMQERGIKRILTEDDHFLHIGMGLQKVP